MPNAKKNNKTKLEENQKTVYRSKMKILANLSWIIVLIGVILLVHGISGIGSWKIESHEEAIVYPDYSESVTPGTDVKFDAVSAEILGYTYEISTKTTKIGDSHYTTKYTDHYAYMLLTDAAGNQALVYKMSTSNRPEGNNTLSLGSDISVDEMDALVAEINDNGKTFYGTVGKNEISSQQPENTSLNDTTSGGLAVPANDSSLDPRKQKVNDSGSLNQAAAFQTVICLYDDGEQPATQNVVDSDEFVLHIPALICAIIGGCLLLLGMFFWNIKRKNRAVWQAEELRRGAEKFHAVPLEAEQEKKKNTASGPAAPASAEQQAAELPHHQSGPANSSNVQQKNVVSDRKKSTLTGMLPALSGSGESLTAELLSSDPAELQKALRTADSLELRSLMDHLSREMKTAGPEDQEILKTVYNFADGVLKHE